MNFKPYLINKYLHTLSLFFNTYYIHLVTKLTFLKICLLLKLYNWNNSSNSTNSENRIIKNLLKLYNSIKEKNSYLQSLNPTNTDNISMFSLSQFENQYNEYIFYFVTKLNLLKTYYY